MPEQNIDLIKNTSSVQAPSSPEQLPPSPTISAPVSKKSLRKSDLIVALIIGEACAWLVWPIFQNLVEERPYLKDFNPLSLTVILPVLSIIGLYLAHLISKKIKVVYQFAKFVLVGTLNTFIDWGILNLLMLLTSIVSGPFYSVFKGISFIIASTNSYFWNKFWTFKVADDPSSAKPKKAAGKEVLQFYIISVIGFALNVGVASLIVNVLKPQFGIDERLWANIGAFGGTLVGLMWNFLGYKFVVFEK